LLMGRYPSPLGSLAIIELGENLRKSLALNILRAKSWEHWGSKIDRLATFWALNSENIDFKELKLI
jgi:hypothetical protein